MRSRSTTFNERRLTIGFYNDSVEECRVIFGKGYRLCRRVHSLHCTGNVRSFVFAMYYLQFIRHYSIWNSLNDQASRCLLKNRSNVSLMYQKSNYRSGVNGGFKNDSNVSLAVQGSYMQRNIFSSGKCWEIICKEIY